MELIRKKKCLVSFVVSYLAMFLVGLAEVSLNYLYLAWLIWYFAIFWAFLSLKDRINEKKSLRSPVIAILFALFLQYWCSMQVWAGYSEKYADTLLGKYFWLLGVILKPFYGLIY